MKIYFKIMFVLMLFSSVAFTACSGDDSNDDTPAKIYSIDDTGPSGVGIVFYVTDGGLHGFEAAPPAWNPNGLGEPTTIWSTIINAYANGSSPLPEQIGTGSANTTAIIEQNNNANSAAKECRSYNGGSKTDWFLPSSAELYQLYIRRNIVGGFTGVMYWSSSESTVASLAMYLSFSNGVQNSFSKSTLYSVRPVSAF